jgi:hypothetical protein
MSAIETTLITTVSTLQAPRWVRKDVRIYHDSHCLLCGACYGILRGSLRRCAEQTCLACGSKQCNVNGLSRGQCGICYIGLLPGWIGNDRQCSYQGCHERAIVRVDGANKARCRVHLERGKWAGYLAKRLAERDRQFREVDAATVREVL